MLSSILVAVGSAVGLFGGILAGVELGYRSGRRQAARDPQGAHAGTGAVEAAVFGLLGLLLAFTFSGAASRFDARRSLAVEEVNDIGTAWLRLDLLAAEDRLALRKLFEGYVDNRIAVYRAFPDLAAARVALAEGNALQARIWSQATEACGRAGNPAAPLLLLPALNAMIDITTTRTWAALFHMPLPIFAAIFLVAMLAALLVGHAMAAAAQRNRVHAILFSAAVSLTVYMILDFEYPRVGLIRLDSSDQVLVELRESMR
jgi:hypothetical protein